MRVPEKALEKTPAPRESESKLELGNACRSEPPEAASPETAQLQQLFREKFAGAPSSLCPGLFSHQPSIQNHAPEVIRLVGGAGKLTSVHVKKEVYDQLAAVFNHEYETGFLLFADTATGAISKAVETPHGGNRSIALDADQMNLLKMEQERFGLKLVGLYHSHPFTAEQAKQHKEERMAKVLPQYRERTSRFDESLLSRVDHSGCDGQERMDQFQLVGSAADEKGFKVRAFLIAPKRNWSKLGVTEQNVDPQRFVSHYTPQVGDEEHYELDLVLDE